VVELDVIRCLGIVVVISLWHAQGYVAAAAGWSTIQSAAGESFTAVAVVTSLGLVALVSGYGIAYGYGVLCSRRAAVRFLVRRILRLYPMYALALTVTLTVTYPGPSTLQWVLAQYACAGMLFTRWLGPPVLTLWFVQLILVYYVAYAAVMIHRSRRARQATLVILVVALTVATLVLRICDIRILEYAPAFIVGVLAGGAHFRARVNAWFWVACVGFAAVAGAVGAIPLLSDATGVDTLLPLLAASVAPLALLPGWALAAWVVRHVSGRLVAVASYASFGAYLFHRTLLGGLAFVWEPSPVVVAEIWFAVVGLILSFFLGFAVQRGDDLVFGPLLRPTGRREPSAIVDA
jgi:peptidoglycan/LPS O-acetylase OafA/YrhL